MSISIFITGSSGFLGGHLTRSLDKNGIEYTASKKNNHLAPLLNDHESSLVVDFTNLESTSALFKNFNTVIHLANLATLPNDKNGVNFENLLVSVNVRGTETALRCAAHNGVKRFIYLSSLKALGENTPQDKRFSTNSKPSPQDPYGESKLAAEQLIQDLAPKLGIEYVIIRPPLVYGPNAKGNFASIVKLVRKGFPLPFKAVTNQRSMVYVGNLVDLIIRCIDHPAAANKIFMVCDGKDLSLPQLIQLISANIGVKNRVFWFPEKLFWLAGALTGRREICQKLFGSLRVDMSHTVKTLNWQPPYTVEEGIRLSVTNSSENSDKLHE